MSDRKRGAPRALGVVKSVTGLTGVLAVSLAALVAPYGVYLVALGPLLVVVTPSGAVSAVHQPNPAGLVLIVGPGLVWYGIQRGKQRWAWIGAAVVLAFSVMFVFGPGGILIPLAIAVVAVLIARHMLAKETQTAGRTEP
jgi:hypothetical protein